MSSHVPWVSAPITASMLSGGPTVTLGRACDPSLASRVGLTVSADIASATSADIGHVFSQPYTGSDLASSVTQALATDSGSHTVCPPTQGVRSSSLTAPYKSISENLSNILARAVLLLSTTQKMSLSGEVSDSAHSNLMSSVAQVSSMAEQAAGHGDFVSASLPAPSSVPSQFVKTLPIPKAEEAQPVQVASVQMAKDEHSQCALSLSVAVAVELLGRIASDAHVLQAVELASDSISDPLSSQRNGGDWDRECSIPVEDTGWITGFSEGHPCLSDRMLHGFDGGWRGPLSGNVSVEGMVHVDDRDSLVADFELRNRSTQ
jgi:hypothetical protein